MSIPNELIEQFSRGNGAIFVGAGLSIGAGLPGWGDLMQRLSSELVDCPANTSYLDLAQYYVIQFGKNRLISRLREELETIDIQPTAVHNSLVQLKISPLFTTNYDNLLEKALQAASIRFDPIVTTVDASFWTSDRVQLVKFHGDINQPVTVVITSEDYEKYYSEHPALTRLLSTTLQTRTLLLLGYSATDIDFRSLLTQVQSESGTYARNAYAVMFDAPGLVMKDMERRGIQVINFVGVESKDRNEKLAAWLEELAQKTKDKKPGLLKSASKKKRLPSEPYKFLHWFGEEDVAIFHGRDYEIKRLVNLVETQHITILYGESGTGKTSILRAGLLPALKENGVLATYLRPLVNPFQEMEEAIRSAFGIKKSDLSTLQEIITSKLSEQKTLLIIFDQFEEFFIRQGADTRKEFEKVLADILAIPNKHIHFLFSLRSDYLDRLDELEDVIGHDPLRFRIRLHDLGSASASIAILEPAKDFGISLDQTLLEKLVSDLGEGSIAPPQLQIVCYSLWKDWVDNGKPKTGLTINRYIELGSTQEILANYLTRVIDDLSQPQTLNELSLPSDAEIAQATAKAILKSMITSEKTKIAVSSKEITQSELIINLNAPASQIEAILHYLQNRRIVRHIPDSQYYELVHEVMINQIWGWITDSERQILDIQDILQRAMTDFFKSERLLLLDDLNLIAENAKSLFFTDNELKLLLTSAIHHDDKPDLWVERMKPDYAIEILGGLLSSERKVLYPQIATALGHTKSAKAVRYLAELSRDDDRKTQHAAALAMTKLNVGGVVPAIFHALMKEENLQRAAPFLDALETIHNEEATAMLMLVEKEHKDVGVRKRATRAVFQLNNPKGFRLLLKQLNSQDSLIYASSINVLETIIEEKPQETLAFFKESEANTRILVVRGLSNIKSDYIFELLSLAIQDQDPEVRCETVKTLGRLKSERAIDLLLPTLEDTDPEVRHTAIANLGNLGDERVLRSLIALLKNNEPNTRKESALALGNIASIDVFKNLINAIEDENPDVQKAVRSSLKIQKDLYSMVDLLDVFHNNENTNKTEKIIDALELNKNQEIIPLLLTALKSDNIGLRRWAVQTLGNFNKKSVLSTLVVADEYILDTLIEVLTDNNVEIRRDAVWALNRIKNVRTPDALIVALKDNDSEVRRRAVKVLGQTKDVRAIDALIDALKDNDVEVRWQVVQALGQFNNEYAVDPLIAALKDDDAEVRRWAVQALGQIKDGVHITDALIPVLKDNNIEVRRQAVQVLGQIKDIRAVDALIATLKYDNVGVRRQAVQALGQIKDVRIVDALIAAFGDNDVEVGLRAIQALGLFNNEYVLDALIAVLKTDNVGMRRQAVQALGQMKDTRAVDALMSALKDENAGVRRQAVQALGQMKDVRAVDALVEALKDDDIEVRQQAVQVLGQIKDVHTVNALIAALNDDDVEVQRQVIQILGQIEDVRAVDALITLLKDDDFGVRPQVVQALGQLNNEYAINALITVLKGNDIELRRQAVDALGQMKDVRAIDALIIALKNDDIKVRWRAIQVLGQFNNKYAVDSLVTILRDGDSDSNAEVRWRALQALGLFNTQYVVDALLAVLKNDNVRMRYLAVQALGQIKHARAVDVLKIALKDGDIGVQRQAESALKKIRKIHG